MFCNQTFIHGGTKDIESSKLKLVRKKVILRYIQNFAA